MVRERAPLSTCWLKAPIGLAVRLRCRTTEDLLRPTQAPRRALWSHSDTTGIDDSDVTKLKNTLIQELESVAKAAGSAGLDGILYVLPHGRTDPTDDMVARFLLSVLYKVPPAMVAVVITGSPQDEMKSADPAEDFRQMLSKGDGANPGLAKFLLERCENKVCFIENADPSKEILLPTTTVRKKSLENITALLRRMRGKVTSKDLQNVR